MSGRFRYRRRSGYGARRSRSFSGFRTSRSSLVRRARGNARAANAQSDTADVVVNVMTSGITMVNPISFARADDDIDEEAVNKFKKATMNLGSYAVNVYELLAKSDFFNCYAPMYDQFRITSIKVKVTPVKWQTFDQSQALNNYSSIVRRDGQEAVDSYQSLSGNLSAGPFVAKPGYEYQYPQALTLVTAWDRSGLSNSQFGNGYNLLENYLGEEPSTDDKDYFAKQLQYELSGSNETRRINSDNGVGGEYTFNYKDYFVAIGDRITTYSSAQTKQLISGQAFNCTRYLYPSSQQEKSQFLSTSKLQNIYERNSDRIFMTFDNVNLDGISDTTSSNNGFANVLTDLREHSSCPFKPTFIISVLGEKDCSVQPATVTEGEGASAKTYKIAYYNNKIRPVKFNLEFDIGVTFRGLRKTQVV